MAYPAAAYDLVPWYNLTRQGKVFTGNIAAAGVVLPIYSNTTQQLGLWNPYGNTNDLIVKSISLTYVDTTGAAQGINLANTGTAGNLVVTGTGANEDTRSASSIAGRFDRSPNVEYAGRRRICSATASAISPRP